ncbi:MAG: MBL fold metallo-hydrolase [Lachnospiraceae bacterium]|nr:MBL fold metallo-hydrolase [Lachnospiraceae bacterium]
MSNGYFVVGDKGVIAVDTGAEFGAEAVQRILENAGLKPEDITLILITHGHVDHFMNIQAWIDVTRAPVMCHENAKRFIVEGLLPDVDLQGRTRMGKELWAAQQKEGNPIAQSPSGKVDIVFGDDGIDLKPWGVNAIAVYTPGHTRGDCSVVVGDEAIVGDLFTAPAWTDLAGMTYFTYLNAPYEQAQESVQKLLNLGVKRFWSGHGNPRDDVFVRKALEDEKNGKEMYYTKEEIIANTLSSYMGKIKD